MQYRYAVMMGILLGLLGGADACYAGYIRDLVMSKGGCHPGTMMMMGGSGLRGTLRFLGKQASEWTDEDLAEFRAIYTACARRYPYEVASGPNPSPADIDAGANKNINQVIHDFIEPARAEARAKIASADAQRRLEADRVRRIEDEQRQRAERERQAAADAAQLEAKQVRSREQALREQAERDKLATEDAMRKAAEEEPRIAEAVKQAREAAREREAAERRLAEIRGRVAQEERRQRGAIANAQRDEALAQQEQQKEADRIEDLKLARKCKVTLDQFKTAKLGSSLRDVERLFGCKGTETSGTRISGYGLVVTYSWDGETFPSSVTGTFRNSHLESKAQIGLE